MSGYPFLSGSRDCWRCRYIRPAMPVVAWWTWKSGLVDAVCQEHLDESFDCAGEDAIAEPKRVQWLDGSRTLVTA